MPQTEDSSFPSFAVSVDGTALPVDAATQLSAIRVEEDSFLPSMFTLELRAGGTLDDETAWIDGTLFPIGSSVEIKLGYGDAIDTLIVGEITGLEPAFSQGAAPTLTVRGYDLRHRLLRGRKTRSFVQQKDSDIASTIASDAGLTADTVDTQVVHDYVLQTNQTDMEFLQERARRIEYELSVDEKTLHFRPVQNDQGEVLTVTPGDDLLEFRPRLSTLRQLTDIEVRGWSPKDKEALVGKAAAGDEVSTMGGTDTGAAIVQSAFGDAPVLLNAVPVLTQAEADQIAKARFNRALLDLILGDGICLGRTDLRAGTVIKIDGVGTRFSGQYYIKSTSHCYTRLVDLM
jgi:phage protein D